MVPATVHLVDDDASFLRSLSRLLRASGYAVVTHPSAKEFLKSLQPGTRGCLITDLRMPGMDGMALQEALRQNGSPLPILFLTGHGDIPVTVQAMRRGAEDFLTKDAPRDQLLGAVDRALARNEQEHAERSRRDALRRRFETLSPRECEVLRGVLRGSLNKQIASDLGIHERTVKLHRFRVTTKLGVHSVAELTRLAQDAGFQ
ncbi:MAG: response regulator transcription factor [Verrucomicrobiae bacterium]|nr:response regulator transcription factor [Verrucomicrobiae bacterium]